MNSQSPTPKELEVEKLFTSRSYLAPSAELIEAILGYTEAQLTKKDEALIHTKEYLYAIDLGEDLNDAPRVIHKGPLNELLAEIQGALSPQDTNKSEGVG